MRATRGGVEALTLTRFAFYRYAMRHSLLALVLVAALTRIGRAEDAADVKAMIEDLPMRDSDAGPRFAFTDDRPYQSTDKERGGQPNFMGSKVAVTKQVTGLVAGGMALWVAAEVKGVPQPGDCAPGPCAPNRDLPHHLTALLVKRKGGWDWMAWHVAPPVDAKEEARLLGQVKVDKLATEITGAEDVVALFRTTMQVPEELAKSVSDRRDVVLYGSATAERTVGGAKVRAKLAAWNLSFKIVDGVQAAVSTSKTAAFVAANVEATSLKNPKQPASPYRVLAIYEKGPTTWRLVSLHFSVDKFTYEKP